MIDFQQVTKRFGTQPVLLDASFRINPGERIGIVGPNGSGKSTIAGLISGESTPDSGRITMPNNTSIGFLHQQIQPQHTALSLLEYSESGVPELQKIELEISEIESRLSRSDAEYREALLAQLGELQTAFEHRGGYDLRHRIEAALTGLGFRSVDLRRPVGEFSGGWQMRASLIRCLVATPHILILDEPSNYLDLPAIEWLQRFLRAFKGTLILISHDRYLLNTLTSITIEVANGLAERYPGNYDSYIRERTVRYESRIAAQRNQDRKREKAQKFVERFRSKATKASQVKSRIKMIEKMDSVEIPLRIVSKGTIRIPSPQRCGQEVVRLEDAAHSYDGKVNVLKNINLRIERGEKVALVGHNGLGKTTLLRMLAGKLPVTAGSRVLGHKVITGYQSQEFADTMDAAATVLQTVKSQNSGLTEQTVRGLLGGFGFSGDAVEKQVSVLSGGEKVRLAFARLLANPPNFLLLDEPTTHLDITARETLEDALRQYEGTLCFVSHDVSFVENIAERIIAMDPPGILNFNGGYDYYREKTAATAVNGKPRDGGSKKNTLDKKEQRRQRAAARKATAAEVRELRRTIKRAEQQIEIFETEQAKLLKTLSNPPEGIDFAETNRRMQLIRSEISQYTLRWEEASEQLEELEAD